MWMTKRGAVGLLFCLVVVPSSAWGQITADYRFDSTGFFTDFPDAKLAVEAAIADLDAALNQNLNAIASDSQEIQRTSGTATVTAFFEARVRDPSSSSGQRFTIPIARDASEVRLFLGAMPQSFQGNTSVLGTGGTAGYRFQASFGFGNTSDLTAAVNAVATEANDVLLRGDGPEIGRFEGEIENIPYSIGYGLAHGSVSFDNDSNNNGVNDVTEGVDLGNQFHFDHTVAPPSGKSDFYTVALHEAIHAVGLGGTDQWNSLIDGQDWLGSEVIDYLGTGQNLIDADGGHIVSGIMSPRITDGVLQESVLTPQLDNGMRRVLTELDLAFFRDMGFAGAVVPPRSLLGDFDGDGDVDADDIDFYSGNLGQPASVNPALDLTGDGEITLSDHDFHVTNYAQTSNGQTGTLIGDTNLDGTVDVLTDAFRLIDNLGATGNVGFADGDINADQRVDVLGDGFLLVNNLGQTNSPSGSGVATAAAVPEPSVGLLFGLSAIGFAGRRRVAR